MKIYVYITKRGLLACVLEVNFAECTHTEQPLARARACVESTLRNYNGFVD